MTLHLCEPTPAHGQVLTAGHVSPSPAPPARQDVELASEADRMRQLHAAIATRLERGATVDAVERELIAASGLPEEQQSALWLYAWSHPKRRRAGDQPPLPVRAALANALFTLIGIYRH